MADFPTLFFCNFISVTTGKALSASVYLSWFYGLWLLVFHIITSCRALGVKEFCGLSVFSSFVDCQYFWVPCSQKKRTMYPRRLSLFCFLFFCCCCSEGKIKLFASHKTSLFFLLFISAACAP